MTVTIPVGGFAPGQTINIEIETFNNSDQVVSTYTVFLCKVSILPLTRIKHSRKAKIITSIHVQEIVYHIFADSPRERIERKRICEKETESGCDQNESKIHRVSLKVSLVPPTDNTSSAICKVRYYIEVS